MVNGKAYQNPKFVSLKDETLTLAHAGALAKIELGSMDAKAKQQMAAALKIDPARRQAVADAVKKYLQPTDGNLESAELENKVNMNIDSLVDEHEKIAMKSDVRHVVVIIKYRIERDQFIKLLAAMKLIRV